MSESKAGDDDEYLAQLPQVDILRVDVSPNPTHISDELNLEVDFTVNKDVLDGWWEVQVPQINVASIKPSNLANCGLLIASFKTRANDIMDLKMVVQVSKQGDTLQRIIYNPLE
ncbi:hypothetical protein DYB37_000548 [Aphanomyces astaci]|uniref:Uncharacterized protein n=1 Tax=Aphanomyces astaci TaxID=112090 RepID=A0A3R7W173_APHAT|nr:hypothetical protein DYB35_000171 [Aphanomyces astaci]RHZ27497.1 hypothetical protein DYB37_000548 [Aphanomyces astaci]RQM11961.1 hypothetical protein B5M09_000840 [Aphanomyces astaci]